MRVPVLTLSTLGIILSCTTISAAQDSNASGSNLSPQFIISRAKLASPESGKLAYVGLKAKQAYAEAIKTSLPMAEVEQRVNRAVAEAHEFVDGNNFRNGWIEFSLKSGMNMLGQFRRAGQSATYKEIVGPALDKLIERGLDAVSEPGRYPSQLSDGDIVNLNVWMYGVARDYNNPLAPLFLKEIEQRHQIRAERNFSHDPNVALEIQTGMIISKLNEEGLNIDDLAIQLRDSNKFLETKLKPITALMNQSVAEMKGQAAQRHSEIEKSDITGSFAAASAMAMLLDRPQDAANFSKAERLAGAVYDIAHNGQAFSTAPFLVVNPYLAAAVIAFDLIGGISGGDKTDANKAVLAELSAIRQELREFRIEMTKRFDQLEFSMQTNFTEVKTVLEAIRDDQATIIDGQTIINNQINTLQDMQRFGNDAIGRLILLGTMDRKCTSADSTVTTSDQFADCRDKLATLASGGFTGAFASPDVAGLGQQQGEFRENEVISYLAQIYLRLDDPYTQGWAVDLTKYRNVINNPSQFLWGMFYLKQIAFLNPQFQNDISRFRYSMLGVDIDYSFLLNAGLALEDWRKTLAVVPGAPVQLRENLFKAVVNEYKTSIEKILSRVDSAIEARRADTRLENAPPTIPRGPRMNNFDYEAPSITDPLMQQRENKGVIAPDLKKWAILCKDVRVTLSPLGSYVPFNYPMGSIHSVPQDYNLTELRDNINKKGQYFRFNTDIFEFIPSVAKWALLTKIANSRLDGCLSKFEITGWHNSNGSEIHGATVRFTLDVNYSYDESVKSRRTFLVTRLSGTQKVSSQEFMLRRAPPLPSLYWNGGYGEHRDGTDIPFSGIAQAGSEFKKVVVEELTSEEQTKRDQEIVIFRRFYTGQLQGVEQKLQKDLWLSLSDLDRQVRLSKAALRFLLMEGVSGADSSSFLDWLDQPDNMPGGFSWATAMIRTGATLDDAKQKLAETNRGVEQLIESLGRSKELRAGPDPFADYVEFLEANAPAK